MRPLSLNWFSPLPPAQTGIATYTQFLLPALAERFEVNLWTEQSQWDSSLEQWATVHPYEPENPPISKLRMADITVYNLGNDARFHAGIWQVSQRFSGVVLLHDVRLHHMFLEAFRSRWNNRDGYIQLLEKYYGAGAHVDGLRSWQGSLDTNELTMRWPLTEAAVDHAQAVIVHNGAVQRQVQQYSDRPVIYTPIPHSQVTPRQKRRVASPPYRLLIFGHLGTNRRVESLLAAWSQMPERDLYRLDIAGEPWSREELSTLIRSHNLQRQVFTHGFVSDEKLSELLDRADLGINLRYPSMGEASGSLLRMWEHALPAIVTRVGWYAALPQNSVAFVRQEHELEDIQQHLRRLAASPDEFAQMGLRGHQYVARRHTPERFAQMLETLMRDINHQRLAKVIHGLAGQIAVDINGWEPASAQNGFINRLANHLDDLFGDVESQPLAIGGT